MRREEYIEDVKISLGAPVVDIEVEQIIGKLVDKAFREVSRYIVETKFLTLPYTTNGIDLTKYHVDSIIQIFRTRNPNRVADFSDIYALSSVYNANTTSTNLMMSDYLYRTQLHQLKSAMSTDLDFTYDKPILHVATFYPKPDMITIAYIPEFTDVSDVKEQFWINYIQRLALAFTKESLGRVRGKYKLTSSLYTLDGDTLVSEGIAERDAIRAELNDLSDVVFPMD